MCDEHYAIKYDSKVRWFRDGLAASCNAASGVEPVGFEPTRKGLKPSRVTQNWPHFKAGLDDGAQTA